MDEAGTELVGLGKREVRFAGGVDGERAAPVGIDLAGPFDGMFTLNSADATIAVNWGIAAVVYLIVGAVVAWLIALIGTARLRQRSAVTT